MAIATTLGRARGFATDALSRFSYFELWATYSRHAVTRSENGGPHSPILGIGEVWRLAEQQRVGRPW